MSLEYLIIKSHHPTLKLPQPAHRYLQHGWQSWSLAAWTDCSPLSVPQPAILHPLQTDPLYANESRPHGSWFGAVELANGEILLLGALGLGTHVRLNDPYLEGWAESGFSEWIIARGAEGEVFDFYAQELGRRFGAAPKKPAPRVWCSWYSFYNAITEKNLAEVFTNWGDFPFDVFQIDDGWQERVGDWQPNDRFPSGMAVLAEKIRQTGRKAGLWLAPLIAVKSSRLFRQHADWFVRDEHHRFISAGFNWGEPLFALDTTHPEVQTWLSRLMRQVREWGYEYLKLDFLYAGALPGRRYGDMPREEAYREGLRVMRQAMGDDAFFLACGAPIFPSLGLCDALRIGPDVSGEWESFRDAVLLYNPAIPGVKNAIRTSIHRLWLKTLVQIDPDVVYFSRRGNSLRMEEKALLQHLARVCEFRATSDLPQRLDDEEKQALRAFLEEQIVPRQLGRAIYQLGDEVIDFSPAIGLPAPPRGGKAVQAKILSWLANHTWALRLLYWQNQRALMMQYPPTSSR